MGRRSGLVQPVAIALIRSQGWPCEYDYRDQRRPSAAALFVPDPEGWTRTLWAGLDPGLVWIERAWAPDEIDSDVSLHQIHGQERLDASCSLLRTLDHALAPRTLTDGDVRRRRGSGAIPAGPDGPAPSTVGNIYVTILTNTRVSCRPSSRSNLRTRGRSQ